VSCRSYSCEGMGELSTHVLTTPDQNAACIHALQMVSNEVGNMLLECSSASLFASETVSWFRDCSRP